MEVWLLSESRYFFVWLERLTKQCIYDPCAFLYVYTELKGFLLFDFLFWGRGYVPVVGEHCLLYSRPWISSQTIHTALWPGEVGPLQQ